MACRSAARLASGLCMTEDKDGVWEALTKDFGKKIATVSLLGAIAASALTGNPGDAFAAQSGGRMSGRSFSSPSRSYSAPSRSYSAPSRSYSGGGVVPVPVPVPSYGFGGFSPFGGYGYSPFMGPGIMYSSSSFINPVDLLVLGGVAYAASQLLKGPRGGFGDYDMDSSSALGEGVDVVKLQVALNSEDRSPRSILGALTDLAGRGNTDSRAGLAAIVSEVSLALGRRKVEWVAASSAMEHFSSANKERAEATFNRLSVAVRSATERETRTKVGAGGVETSRLGLGGDGGPTLAVVTIVLALRGDSLRNLGLERNIAGVAALRSALEAVATGALSDNGENVLAAEVLWTPEEPWEVLTREEAIMDFPELMDL
ncbi:unnamed protein product [Discosporangium mesarthrocarpum]